jgi:hypothetical protein
MSNSNSRLRAGEVAGVVVVAFFVCFAVLAGLDARTGGRRVVIGAEASDEFLDAWARSRDATYAAETLFTRSRAGGASLRFAGVRVQRPPDELVVTFSDSELRRDDEVFRCVGGADEADFRCFGPTPGPTHDARVRAELDALVSYFAGDQSLYAVTAGADGCFALEQARTHPVPPYGRRARFCFDPATGALRDVELRFDNGVIERTEVTSIDPVVTDEDLRLPPPG